MSIGKTDIRMAQHPAQGTLKERLIVTLGVAETVTEGSERAIARAVDRIYGDIARDFEAFVKLVAPHGVPEEAERLCESIRARLRGDTRA